MILVDIGIKGDEAAHKKVVATLDQLASSHTTFQGLGAQVTRWREIRHLPVEQQIQQLNVFIHHGGLVDPIFFGRLRGC
jgi:hypothetical protein